MNESGITERQPDPTPANTAVELPGPQTHPAVTETQARLDGITAGLAAVRRERQALEQGLAVDPKLSQD